MQRAAYFRRNGKDCIKPGQPGRSLCSKISLLKLLLSFCKGMPATGRSFVTEGGTQCTKATGGLLHGGGRNLARRNRAVGQIQRNGKSLGIQASAAYTKGTFFRIRHWFQSLLFQGHGEKGIRNPKSKIASRSCTRNCNLRLMPRAWQHPVTVSYETGRPDVLSRLVLDEPTQ